MPSFIDLSGMQFGSVKVLERTENKGKDAAFICLCQECGKTFITRGRSLRAGEVVSCGCTRQKRATAAALPIITKHGEASRRKTTKLYNIWLRMKSRCNIPTTGNYKYYGARGIRVCEEWQHDYKAFKEWAIANGYKEGLSIDRIDVNGNYSPDNCRWITMAEQQKNKRKSKK